MNLSGKCHCTRWQRQPDWGKSHHVNHKYWNFLFVNMKTEYPSNQIMATPRYDINFRKFCQDIESSSSMAFMLILSTSHTIFLHYNLQYVEFIIHFCVVSKKSRIEFSCVQIPYNEHYTRVSCFSMLLLLLLLNQTSVYTIHRASHLPPKVNILITVCVGIIYSRCKLIFPLVSTHFRRSILQHSNFLCVSSS